MRARTHMVLSAVLLSSVFSLFLSNPASANSFDPGHIISDSIFTNQGTMSDDQIQRFIEVKGVNCVDGEAPCLKNYRENGKSAGTIIAEAAQQYSINPQVLLVTLQKEVGLLTMSQPGAWRYRTAMGYGCPDSTPGVCNEKYFGFTNQVRWAATMFRAIMNNSPTWYTPYHIGENTILWHPNTACGSSVVNIANRATVALYSYTPYRPNGAALAAGFGTGDSCSSYGNRNFWLYFNIWFGSSVSSLLIQSPQSPAVYLQSGDTRYAIPSWDIINAYGFGRFGVTPVSDTYMNSLQDGGILSTVFSNKAEPGPVYMADNGHRFGFSSYQQCVDWGFTRCTDSSYAKALESSVFDRLYIYGDMTNLMLNGSYLHIMSNGKKYPLLSDKARTESSYGNIKYSPVTNQANLSQPYANSIPHNNSIVSFKNTPTIYVYTNNKFYALTSEAFKALSSATPILIDNVSAYTTTPPPAENTIGSTISFSNGNMYTFVNGKKVNLSAVRQHWPQTPVLDDIQAVVAARPDDYVADNNSTYRTPEGAILKVENKQYRGFYSLRDYFALGYTTPIPVSTSALTKLNTGPSVIAYGSGSIYQLNTQNDRSLIFTTSVDGSPCQLSSIDQLGSYRLYIDNVQRISQLPGTTTELTSVVYDQASAMHVIHSGKHAVIKSSELTSTWGINQKLTSCTLNSSHLSTIPVTATSLKFARDPATGVIYLGENGKKRPIFSYSAFVRLGGSSTNTFDVSAEFIAASPSGASIVE